MQVSKKSEMILHVNRRDQVLGRVNRFRAHVGKGILNRGLLVTVKDRRNRIYLSQRSRRRPDLPRYFPPPFALQWDGTIAGHPKPERRGYMDQAVAELNEELGLVAKRNDLKWLGKFYYNTTDPLYPNKRYSTIVREMEVCGSMILYTDHKPSGNPVEISEIETVQADKVEAEVKGFVRSNVEFLEDGTIIVKRFDQDIRMFTPWFIRAQQLYREEIYGFDSR